MQNICHDMKEAELLNAEKSDLPLFEATLYGSRENTAKLSKRLSCAIKHLPLRMVFHFNYDTLQALETGATKDPTLFLNGELFLEGLVQAEAITLAFENYLEVAKHG